MKVRALAFGVGLLMAASSPCFAQIVNGSFESGPVQACAPVLPPLPNPTGWVVTDIMSPFFTAGVYPAGCKPFPGSATTAGFFTTTPTAGSRTFATGFDGMGPGTITLEQTVSVVTADALVFDYRVAADLLTFCFPPFPEVCMDREFRVEVDDLLGTVETTTIYVASAGTIVLDTGRLSACIDVSTFTGSSARITFIWDVPQSFTGPAFFQLDNVQFAGPGSHAIRDTGGAGNPGTLTLDPAGPPAIGQVYTVTVTAPALFDAVMLDPTGTLVDTPFGTGALLCLPPASPIFYFFPAQPPGFPISLPFPCRASLIGVSGCIQGAGIQIGPLTINPTNAIDFVIGG